VVNTGWIELWVAHGDETGTHLRIRYDETRPCPGQPLIDDEADGAAFVAVNGADVAAVATVGSAEVSLPPGTTKLTAAELADLGIETREQVCVFLASP
jgi:hypothetical protein